MDTTVHDRVDQRTHIFVVDSTLVFLEATAVVPKGHRLILQVALPALITDRAIQGMIDKQKLHDAMTRLTHHFGVSEDFHPFAHR